MGQRKQLSLVKYLFLLLSINMFFSCSESSIDREVAPIDIEIDLLRLDQAVFAEGKIEARHKELVEFYPDFYPTYYGDILQLGDVGDSMAPSFLNRYVTDPEWVFAQSQIDSVFSDTELLHSQFSDAFGRHAALFNGRISPDVYIMNSGYNYGVYPIPPKAILAIGAEFYLGAESEMIQRLPYEMFPEYLKKQMNPEQLFPNAMKGWLILNHREKGAKKDLLGLMVTYGKIMYTLHLCIPEVPEHTHFAYTEAEFNWCKENEGQIWKVIVKEDILFSTNKKTLTDWVGRGPFTQGFSEDSPAELAYFIGKQMVKDYMREHPEISVVELMDIPAETVLKSYRPN